MKALLNELLREVLRATSTSRSATFVSLVNNVSTCGLVPHAPANRHMYPQDAPDGTRAATRTKLDDYLSSNLSHLLPFQHSREERLRGSFARRVFMTNWTWAPDLLIRNMLWMYRVYRVRKTGRVRQSKGSNPEQLLADASTPSASLYHVPYSCKVPGASLSRMIPIYFCYSVWSLTLPINLVVLIKPTQPTSRPDACDTHLYLSLHLANHLALPRSRCNTGTSMRFPSPNPQ